MVAHLATIWRKHAFALSFKLSAKHIEDDNDFALEASADYIILDGLGRGCGRRVEFRHASRRLYRGTDVQLQQLPRRHCHPKPARYLGVSVELMQVLARACGHNGLSGFEHRDITTWKKEMADLSGLRFGSVNR